MKMSLSIVLVLVLSSVCCQVFAATPVLDERQDKQKQRIVQGVMNGELTMKETTKLLKGQKDLRKKERKAKADGVVTKKERARLHHNANKESAKIKNKRNL